MGGEHMKIRTYTQLEAILRTAFDIDGNSIKDVATMASINLNTLYKWNCGAMRFSPDDIDELLMYHQMQKRNHSFQSDSLESP